MPFKKGKSGNPNGKPKGAKNLVSRDLRETITTLLEKNWKELSPRDRCRLWVDLLNYSIPKLSSTELTSELDRLTPEELESLTQNILTKMNEHD
jgi:hypothetical protein